MSDHTEKKEVPYIRNWREWRALWDANPLSEFRHSLLHFGFGVRLEAPEERFERICFYLERADGYGETRNFELP